METLRRYLPPSAVHQISLLLFTLKQMITVRSLKRFIMGLICVLCVVLTWWWWPEESPTSAVTCKSKIAQMVWPNPQVRKENLDIYGHDARTIEDEYFDIVEHSHHMCMDQVHLGPEGEGGWELCMDRPYGISQPCLVYSFGIGYDFRFEKAIEEQFGCEVFAFDPSMGVEPHKYSKNGHFYNWGINDKNSLSTRKHWRMRRLSSIMTDLKHDERSIDYLKLDVEFSEWPALHDIIESGLVQKIRQLAIETHTPEMDIHTRPDHFCTWSTKETLSFMLKNLIGLRNAGFRLFYSRTNYRTQFVSDLTQNTRYCCHNLHFVNTKFVS